MSIAGKVRSRWRLIVAIGVVMAAVAAVVFTWGEFDWHGLAASIAKVDPLLMFVLMAVLPLAGFSITVVYLVAGARFGPIGGGAIIAAVTAIHLLASNWIGRGLVRAPIERYLSRRRHHLPHVPSGEHAAAAALAVLVPGPPYFARNYLLALTDVPLRVYFLVCLPLYVAHSYVTIMVGDIGTDLDRNTLAILVAMYVVKIGTSAYLIWRIRRRFKRLGGHIV